MNKQEENYKLLCWVLGIAIIIMITLYFLESKYLTADLSKIDGVAETEYYFIYMVLK